MKNWVEAEICQDQTVKSWVVCSWIKLRMNYAKAEKSELNYVKQNSLKQISGFASPVPTRVASWGLLRASSATLLMVHTVYAVTWLSYLIGFSGSIANLLYGKTIKYTGSWANFFFQLQPTLLIHCSLRNSGYKQEKNVGCSRRFFSHLKSSGLDDGPLALGFLIQSWQNRGLPGRSYLIK